MTDLFPGAKYVQLVEWGYPLGSLRTAPPPTKAYSVIHITGNSELPSAESEAAYRKNNTGLQNSATFFVNRDGTVVQCLGDPAHMDPWTNGDLRSPDLTNPRIAALVTDGVNANERSLLTIENVGYEPGYPITAAQEATCAKIIAYYHPKSAVPITRQTVIGHYQLNSETRKNCPGVNKDLLDRIVTLAAGYTSDMAPGTKPAGPPIGTFAWTGTGHALISPTNTAVRFPQSVNPGPFAVVAALDLKTPMGASVDIDGRTPAQNKRDQVYLVDGPTFGTTAYVLRADGTFTATSGGFTQKDIDKARAEGSAAMDALWEQWNTTAQEAKP